MEIVLGKWIRRKRVELGLRQSDVAARAGISQTSVSHVETGTAKVTTVTSVLDALFTPRRRVR